MGTFSGQIRGIDLPSIFAAAQQYRANEAEMQRRKSDQARTEQLRQVYGRFLQGDEEAGKVLMQTAPEVYQEAEGKRQELAVNALKARQAEEDQQAQVLQNVGSMFQFVAKAPPGQQAQAWAMARAQAAKMGVNDVPEQPDMGYVQHITGLAESMRARPRANDPTSVQEYNFYAGQAQSRGQKPMPYEDWVQLAGKSRSTNINIGPDGTMAPTKGMTDKLQDDIMAQNQMLSAVDDIMSTDYGRWLTYVGQGAVETYRKAEKLGLSTAGTRSDIKDAAKFTSAVDQLFNSYRKLITGAAASEQELARIEQSYLSRGMSKSEFEANVGLITRRAKRANRAAKYLLTKNFQLGSKEYGASMDFMLRGDPAAIDKRGDTLKASGLSDPQVVAQLKDEGWID